MQTILLFVVIRSYKCGNKSLILKVFELKLKPQLLKFLFFSILWGNLSLAQTSGWSPILSKTVLPGADSLLIDSFPVVLSSISLQAKDGMATDLNFIVRGITRSYLVFPTPLSDTLLLRYSIIPIDFNSTLKNKDTSLIISELTQIKPNLYEIDDSRGFKPFDGLNSKGSISRGITIGNNQDAVLNSTLNLQLSGRLGKDTEIRASITDNNIPVQSDGYTQQLREFDRVYIELENKDFGLIRAGDYNVESKNNYFLKFDKRISGAGLFTNIKTESGEIPIGLQAGIARGRFSRNRFQGVEGNQGPYKLTGANGERFVIIISGSEKVYVDGVLMKRGQQYDYIMDYNAGEIIFTSLQPITKDKRVAVEFQYTEQNYLRSVAFANTGFLSDKVKTNVQFYSEQDSKNQSLVQDLSDSEKEKLSSVGDDLNAAQVSTVIPTKFDPSLIQYRLIDSLSIDSVLVFSTDSTQNLYFASFTFLGSNQGDYILAQNNANGRVYQWVTPINGIPQGSFSPVKQLIAPNQLQILTIESEIQISDKQELKIDLASSKNDVNLFSDLNEENDIGFAGKFNYQFQGNWRETDWSTNLKYEFNQNNFKTIERIRRVEFARDWNLPLNYNGEAQISGIDFGLNRNLSKGLYSFDYLTINGYKGFKNSLRSQWHDSTNLFTSNFSWLSTNDSIRKSNFLREQLDYTHFLLPKFWLGFRSIGEQNEQREKLTDTLYSNSYRFLQYEFFTGLGDTSSSYAEINYMQRIDDTASSGRFSNFSLVNSFGLKSSLKTNFNSRLTAFINVRKLKIFLPVERDIETTITSRLNYIQKFFGNSIISNTFYETGSGTEARRSFSYIEVPVGTGVYTHTDYNGNGIQELDEFEVAPTPDLARFIRIFTPSDDYVRTSLNKFGQNLNIVAPSTWKDKSGLKQKLSYLSLLINYQLNRKTLLTGDNNTLNPFESIDNDTLIVSLNNSFRNTLFFNRSSSIFGLDYTHSTSDNRNLLSFGVEKRTQNENTTNLRYRFLTPLQLNVALSVITKSNSSQNFVSRNFSIDELQNSYSITYQPNDNFTLTNSFKWANQKALSDNNTQLNSQDLGLSINYNIAKNLSASSELNYILNRFEGEVNTPAAFEMLQGLRPGKNGTWGLSIQKTIRKNILLNISYNGRISEDSFPVNIGSVQVKAFF